MRILIATNQLQHISGSEVVALEFARYFQSLGHEIELFANWAGPPMSDIVRETLGLRIHTKPDPINPTAFDLAYFQHQVAGLFDFTAVQGSKPATAIVMGRLARRSFIESGGWLHDNLLADRVLANSPLTLEHLQKVGSVAPASTFHNAAPAAFFRPGFQPSPTLRRILFITNYDDPAVLGAARLLRAGYEVLHVGRTGSGERMVTPELVFGSDVVVTMGKSVQYALASRTPVFVYDHYGGPGYLDPRSRELAARFSFSGRCCERRLSAEALAAEIVDEHPVGVAFARTCTDAWLSRFHLSGHLDELLATPPRSNAERRDTVMRHPFLQQERMLAWHVRKTYIEKMKLRASVEDLRRRLESAGVQS